MAPLQVSSFRKLLVLYLLLFAFSSMLVSAYTQTPTSKNQTKPIKPTSNSTKNQFKPTSNSTKPTSNSTKTQSRPTSNSTKNQTKLATESTQFKKLDSTSKSSNSTKTQTKLIKIATESTQSKKLNSTSKPSNSTKTQTKLIKLATESTQFKKLNSTSKLSNSTKPISLLTNKSSDPTKPSTPKNKAIKPITPKQTQTLNPKKNTWIYEEGADDDLVSEFRDLPSKFQETLLPDLEIISTTSKVYLSRANKEITKGFKPIVGKKYAPTVAYVASFAFILCPLILLSLIFNRIKPYFSLQKLFIFIQVYLSIYFSILSLSSLVTGLEPLRFFYATSRSTYVCVQVLQTLVYVLYLLLLLMYLVLVFSTETGPASKLLGLGQTFVGFAVGLHYYVTVFHRAVLHQPPKSSWRVHAIYATCFLVICLLARAERRKKAYLEEGGEEGKKS